MARVRRRGRAEALVWANTWGGVVPGDAGAGGGGVARVRSQGRTEVGVVLCGRGVAGGGLKTAGRGGRRGRRGEEVGRNREEKRE